MGGKTTLYRSLARALGNGLTDAQKTAIGFVPPGGSGGVSSSADDKHGGKSHSQQEPEAENESGAHQTKATNANVARYDRVLVH